MEEKKEEIEFKKGTRVDSLDPKPKPHTTPTTQLTLPTHTSAQPHDRLRTPAPTLKVDLPSLNDNVKPWSMPARPACNSGIPT